MITIATAKRIGDKLKVNWTKVDLKQLRMGIAVEREHRNIIGNSLTLAAKVALAHLKELPDYYSRLKIAESKDFWRRVNA
jgi:hypothetical protein